MAELRCKTCGRPADLLPLGPKGFAARPSCDQTFRCVRCGQFTVFVDGRTPPEHPEFASDVCSTCRMRERAAGLSAADVVAIRAAARSGVLPAVKVARERLGWPLKEAVSLIHVLGADAEPGFAAGGGSM